MSHLNKKIEDSNAAAGVLNNLNSFLSANACHKKLVISFFFAFSRFEYALKRTGYIVPNLSYAKPDWTRFAHDTAAQFNREQDPKVECALLYLKANPPKQQIEINGSLDWRDSAPVAGQVTLIAAVKWLLIIRNNLFHGGKFPLPVGNVADPARDDILISHALVILNEALEASPRVQSCFNDALE
ncbi:MAG: hypothetical protein NTY98_01525 [Verrucomicrobia bacterium]|nr:hypothetical protein [Verrucomicrobiota bacterium]